MKIAQISLVSAAIAALACLVLLKSDYPSRGEIALVLGAAETTSASASSHPQLHAVAVAPPSATPPELPGVGPPSEGAASSPTAGPAAPKAVASPAPVEPASHAVSQPAGLRPDASLVETGPTEPAPDLAKPQPGTVPGKVAMAVPGPPSSFAARPEPVTPPAEIAPLGASYRTIAVTALRQRPDRSARPLTELSRDTEVTIANSGTPDAWYEVNVPGSGLTGFVEASTVRATSVLEAAEWQRIQKLTDVRSFSGFLHKYPQGVHAKEARARLKKLQAAAADASAPRVRAEPNQHPTPETLSSGRCTSIMEHSQLGEDISDADRAILKNNCR